MTKVIGNRSCSESQCVVAGMYSDEGDDDDALQDYIDNTAENSGGPQKVLFVLFFPSGTARNLGTSHRIGSETPVYVLDVCANPGYCWWKYVPQIVQFTLS